MVVFPKILAQVGEGLVSERFTFIGQVRSGRGVAALHIRENAKELKDAIGENLIEGSLNLVLRHPLIFINENAIKFDHDNRFLWPAYLNGIQVWLYRWQHTPLHIVELLSTVHLRKTLNLRDGDKIKVEMRKADVGVVPNVGKLAWNLCWLGRWHWYYTNDSYYFRIKRWGVEYGATQQNTKKSVRHLLVNLVKTIIRKCLTITYGVIRLKRIFFPTRVSAEPYFFERLPLDSLCNSEDRSFRQVHNLLNYTKLSGSSYSAYRYPAGYHSIEINGRRLQGQRDPLKRLAGVPIDFREKTVLDIGCNQGGMLFQLDGLVKWGVGLDYDSRMINAANRIKSLQEITNLNFYVFNLEKEPLNLIEDFMPEPKVDVVFLLSVCMWLKNWQEVIKFGAEISNSMVFETNGTDEQQSAQEGYLRKLYENVLLLTKSSEDDPRQKRRKLFYCY